jgi:hypothetical protein
MRMLAPAVLAALLIPLAASAATLGLVPRATPRIVDAAATVDFTPDFGGQLVVLGLSPAFADGGRALSDLAIDGALFDAGFRPVLTVSDADGPVIAGDFERFGFDGAGALELLFRTTLDRTGRFGPRLLVLLALDPADLPAGDPFSTAFSATGTATVAAPIPLPGAGPLLLGALGALALGRSARRPATPARGAPADG